MSVIEEVVAERHRQVEQEGFTPEYDDQYYNRQLAYSAACYPLCDAEYINNFT